MRTHLAAEADAHLRTVGPSASSMLTRRPPDWVLTDPPAIIFGFNVKADRGVANMADREGVEIFSHNVIYEIIDSTNDRLKVRRVTASV